MQTIFENEVERSNSGGVSSMGSLICTGRIHRCVERECDRGVGIRRGRI